MRWRPRGKAGPVVSQVSTLDTKHDSRASLICPATCPATAAHQPSTTVWSTQSHRRFPWKRWPHRSRFACLLRPTLAYRKVLSNQAPLEESSLPTQRSGSRAEAGNMASPAPSSRRDGCMPPRYTRVSPQIARPRRRPTGDARSRFGNHRASHRVMRSWAMPRCWNSRPVQRRLPDAHAKQGNTAR